MWESRLERLPSIALGRGVRIAVAHDILARLAGLAGMRALAPRAGLLIPGCRSVHTLGMRFALDLIWLDKRGHVVRIDPSVPPRRVKNCLRARSVIEARAGTADAFLAAGLVGSQLTS